MGLPINKLVMEFLGTFALCLFGGFAVHGWGGANALSTVALAHGLILGIMIYAGAATSGAHYNPAVTVALLLIKKIAVVEAVMYIVSQFVGGILAGVFVSWFSVAPSCGCPNGMSNPLYGAVTGFCVEMIATWFLMFVIMGTAVDSRAPSGVYGIAIGGT